MTDVIDASARLAALSAAAAAQAIFEQRPNLTAQERSAVIGNSLVRAHRDYLGSYERPAADIAFRSAVNQLCKELDSGSIEHGDDDDEFFGPKQAAALLHRRRAG